MKKRAQSGMNAAILVLLISALIILYVLFLPAEERRDLLNETDGDGSSIVNNNEEEILLRAYPGTLDKFDEADDKDIPNVYLFQSTEATEIDSVNAFCIRNGIFDKTTKKAEFIVDDLDNSDNIILTFSPTKSKGELIINLNNENIFQQEVGINPPPVKLKKRLLDEENILEFSVSPVGWKFWTTNEYCLNNVRIIGDITDLSRQESQNIFTLSSEEYRNLEKAKLKFVPYCGKAAEVGVLDVMINNRNIYSAMPVCDDAVEQEFTTSILRDGENKVIFKTNKGSYSIEQIQVLLNTEESPSKLYYFEINESLWKKIEKNDIEVKIRIEFADVVGDVERDDRMTEFSNEDVKRAILNINGHRREIDQEADIYEKYLTAFSTNSAANTTLVQKGNNYIEIVPLKTLRINELLVYTVD